MSKQAPRLTPRDDYNHRDRKDSSEASLTQAPQEQPALEERSQRHFGTSSARRRHSRRGGAPAMFARAGAQVGDGAGHFFDRLDHTAIAHEQNEPNEQDGQDDSSSPRAQPPGQA